MLFDSLLFKPEGFFFFFIICVVNHSWTEDFARSCCILCARNKKNAHLWTEKNRGRHLARMHHPSLIQRSCARHTCTMHVFCVPERGALTTHSFTHFSEHTWPSITVCLPLGQQMLPPRHNSPRAWNQTMSPGAPQGGTQLPPPPPLLRFVLTVSVSMFASCESKQCVGEHGGSSQEKCDRRVPVSSCDSYFLLDDLNRKTVGNTL